MLQMESFRMVSPLSVIIIPGTKLIQWLSGLQGACGGVGGILYIMFIVSWLHLAFKVTRYTKHKQPDGD